MTDDNCSSDCRNVLVSATSRAAAETSSAVLASDVDSYATQQLQRTPGSLQNLLAKISDKNISLREQHLLHILGGKIR